MKANKYTNIMTASNKASFFKMAIFFLFCSIIIFSALRGMLGNPTGDDISSSYWVKAGPFESSNERSRFSLVYSYIEDKTLYYSLPLARFSVPDLAITDTGEYVSLFAPGVSFLLMPGYIIGKYFGIAQIGSFAVISFFAFLNIFFIWKIAIRLGANSTAAAIGALSFAFATPAFAYGATISQHHISTFIILFGFYALLRWNNYWLLALVWFLTAFSITVDNPNIFFMLPIAIYALGRIVVIQNRNKGLLLRVKLIGLLTFFTAVLPMGFFLWYNAAANGGSFQLSGGLERVLKVDNKIETVQIKAEGEAVKNMEAMTHEDESVISFFNTRNLANGFYIHFFSPDRGIINYAPIVLFGVLGFVFLYRRDYRQANILAAIIGFNILLYSMWGDPYGGWAFGSRYLIPAYAILAIGIGFFLTHWKKSAAVIIVFFAVFAYSAGVNTLGALTGNSNPPKFEIPALEKITGKEEKYTYDRNWQYLKEEGSRSFVFKFYAKKIMTAQNYYWLVYGMIVLAAAFLLLRLRSGSLKFDKSLSEIKTEKYVQ